MIDLAAFLLWTIVVWTFARAVGYLHGRSDAIAERRKGEGS